MYGLVLDFDGPLFDGRSAARAAFAATAAHFPAVLRAPFVQFDRLPLLQSTEVIQVLSSFKEISLQQQKRVHAFYKRQLESQENTVRLNPDVARAIRRARAQDIPLAVYSGRPEARIRTLLTRLGLIDSFALLVGSDIEAERKPSAAGLQRIATFLGLAICDLVLVGDSDLDYLSAVAAGSQYLHAGWTGEPASQGLSDPHRVLLAAHELLEVIDCLAADLPKATTVVHSEILQALKCGAFAFCAGAGISAPSGFGQWSAEYRSLARTISASGLARRNEPTAALQLLVSEVDTRRTVFDVCRKTFSSEGKKPNAYHYAMLRGSARHVWTSNYDTLFEDANVAGGFGASVVTTDDDMLEYLDAAKVVVKLNGDFRSARYDDSLNWGVILTQEHFDTADITRKEMWRLFEDDYRSNCILFVGLSFGDPALRRIVTLARNRVRRTRFTHILLALSPKNVLLRREASLFAKSLLRLGIRTLFFSEVEKIQQFVCSLSLESIRPRIGISGSAEIFDRKSRRSSTKELRFGTGTISDLSSFCESIGRTLAAAGYGIVSGGAPHVGLPAVQAAFEINQSESFFVLRHTSERRFPQVAPIIMVPGRGYGAMRQELMRRIHLLLVAAGVPRRQSGVSDEIDLALHRRIPILLFPQFGGVAGKRFRGVCQALAGVYGNSALGSVLREVNNAIGTKDAEELKVYAVNGLAGDVERILIAWVGSNGSH